MRNLTFQQIKELRFNKINKTGYEKKKKPSDNGSINDFICRLESLLMSSPVSHSHMFEPGIEVTRGPFNQVTAYCSCFSFNACISSSSV